jgi:putative hemolysin
MPLMSQSEAVRPFAVEARSRHPWRNAVERAVGNAMERALGLEDLNRIYARVGAGEEEKDFLHRALDGLGVTYTVNEEDLARIPRHGPLLFVSNHPFGGLDGLILAALSRRVRPDARVMANFLLARVPELRDAMIFVDPFGREDSAKRNPAALRQSIRHVSDGGALAVFPAGAVSHLHWQQRAIMDPSWSETIARIVRRTQATVVPIYFYGGNSPCFHLLGTIHPMLRTAMLPRELLNKRHQQVRLEIGTPIEFSKLRQYQGDREMTDYLRLRTYILKTRGMAASASVSKFSRSKTIRMANVAGPEDPGPMLEEVAALGRETVLSETADYVVHVARAGAIPHTLREIGRLRELTFRDVHEGTGKSRDLDDFDQDYLHLFCWSRQKKEVVGAYRLGPTDEILPRHGVKGMYTRTLFRYDQKLMEQLGPALELGRSFVRAEYQRSFSPLLLLWKGIGQYVVRNPRYQVLFGPVSINNQYHSMSRRLIMAFLQHTQSSHLAGLIRANNPPRSGPLRDGNLRQYSSVVKDIDEVSDLVQEIEADRKGIPVLLRQYMKLSARILGFNIDPDFGDVLDGLILVDFRNISPKLVEKFCGKEGARIILQHRTTANTGH